MSDKVYGHFRHAIGANRVRIPSKYRTFLGDTAYAAPSADGCFMLIPLENEELVLGKYNDNDPLLSEYKEISRYINRKMFKVEIDSQGRLTLGSELKDMCKGLESALEVEFCGRGNFIEAWPAQIYDKKYGKEVEEDNLDDLIANLKAKLNKND